MSVAPTENYKLAAPILLLRVLTPRCSMCLIVQLRFAWLVSPAASRTPRRTVAVRSNQLLQANQQSNASAELAAKEAELQQLRQTFEKNAAKQKVSISHWSLHFVPLHCLFACLFATSLVFSSTESDFTKAREIQPLFPLFTNLASLHIECTFGVKATRLTRRSRTATRRDNTVEDTSEHSHTQPPFLLHILGG